jgi:hypothetical protein
MAPGQSVTFPKPSTLALLKSNRQLPRCACKACGAHPPNTQMANHGARLGCFWAKTARFTREAGEQALSDLADRIQTNNYDPSSEYAVSEAVALETFYPISREFRLPMSGSGLLHKRLIQSDSGSAVEHKAEEGFLKQLRGKTAVIHIQPFEAWMSARSHRKLI